MRKYLLLVSLLVYTIIGNIILGKGVGKGRRIDLTYKLNLDVDGGQFAQLFIPDYFSPDDNGKYLLVFHFHSASWAAEDELYKSQRNGILFNIHLGGFSSSYKNYFSDSNKFKQILDLVNEELSDSSIIENPIVKNLVLTSFSAGYGGVREVLKNENYYNSIDALTLADGLHSDLDSNVMKGQMKDFLQFAKDARDKKKIMLLTHSNILTHTYANTTETADYLIENLGIERVPFNSVDEIGIQYSRADKGYFHLKGYRGDSASDHLKHLYNMNLMLKKAVDILSEITR